MSLYAIGDLHLHYQSVLKAPGQLHDRVWKNHDNFSESPLRGVFTRVFAQKPGFGRENRHREAIWNAIFAAYLTFLQDSYESGQDYALVGTKGFTFMTAEQRLWSGTRGNLIRAEEADKKRTRKISESEDHRDQKAGKTTDDLAWIDELEFPDAIFDDRQYGGKTYERHSRCK